MTVTVSVAPVQPSIVLTSDWATILSGATHPGDGTDVIVTITGAPTPDAIVETRIAARAIVSTSGAQSFDTIETLRFGPITVDNVNGDIVAVEARLVAGTGGLIVVNAAGMQGDFSDQPDDGGGGVTQTGITAQPASKTAAPGSSVTFTVSAVGENLSYQWEEWDWVSWSNVGTDQNSYTIPDVTGMDGYQYRVTVTGDNDPGGNPVVSDTVSLTVSGSAAVVTQEPVDVTRVEGNTAVFYATATGVVSWQVYKRTTGTGDGVAHGPPGGAGSTSFTLTTGVLTLSNDGDEYRWEFTGSDNNQVYTRWAQVTVTSSVGAGQLLVTDTEIAGVESEAPPVTTTPSAPQNVTATIVGPVGGVQVGAIGIEALVLDPIVPVGGVQVGAIGIEALVLE